MFRPVIAIDAHYDRVLYPDHVIAANQEATGFEAFRVADGRRDETLWKPTTANAEAWIKVTRDETRAHNIVILDRGHNLSGKQVILEDSDDDFATATTISDITIPTVPGGDIDGSLGLVTEEGAWARRYTVAAAKYTRLRIPAMGAGLVPNVTGLHVGLSWQTIGPAADSFAARPNQLFFSQVQSASGRIGRSRTFKRRESVLTLQAYTEWEFTDRFERWLEQAYRDKSMPMWVALDPTRQAQTLIQVVNPQGGWAFTYSARWPWPTASVPYIENSPSVD